MEFPSHGARPLTVEEFDTTRHLAHAARQARERGLDKITIVDCDLHHDETTSFRDIVGHIDSTVERQLARSATNEGRRPMIPQPIIPTVRPVSSRGMKARDSHGTEWNHGARLITPRYCSLPFRRPRIIIMSAHSATP